MKASDHQWQLPTPQMALTGDEVHIWRVSLERPYSQVYQLENTLSSDERSRAESFHFKRDRNGFIVRRGVLRTILGRYSGIEPGQLQFCYESSGKPFLSGKSGNNLLRFNLSHSHKLAVYAFTLGREIGIDLEYIRPMSDAEQIASRFFSSAENAVIQALPEHKREEAFFNCWTRKEAYIKAIGAGLTKPLDQFEVSLLPGEPARLLRVEGNPDEVNRWSFETFRPTAGYVAALIVEGCNLQINCWQYP